MEKVMQKWKSYGKHFQQNRLYMGILLLTAVCAYGYKVTNATIGIDDTPSLYYFEEGLIAIVGRWVLFLLNKVVSLAEFVPFVTDFAAVVILERAFQMRREPVGEEQGDQRRQPDDGEPLPFGLGDAFLYVLERHGDPDEAVRKLPDGCEGDGRIDQIRIQRIAVADADPEPLPEGGSDFLAIRVVVEVVQVDPAGVGFREHGPVRADEGDADAELRADPVEGG